MNDTVDFNLEEALEDFAREDVETAKRAGVVCITETLQGNIEVSFADGRFQVTQFNTGATLLSNVTEHQVKLFLKSAYRVEG